MLCQDIQEKRIFQLHLYPMLRPKQQMHFYSGQKRYLRRRETSRLPLDGIVSTLLEAQSSVLESHDRLVITESAGLQSQTSL